jgi:hypothetical protein
MTAEWLYALLRVHKVIADVPYADLPAPMRESLEACADAIGHPLRQEFADVIETLQRTERTQARLLDELPKHRRPHWLVFRDSDGGVQAMRAAEIARIAYTPSGKLTVNGYVVHPVDQSSVDAMLRTLARDGTVTFVGEAVRQLVEDAPAHTRPKPPPRA